MEDTGTTAVADAPTSSATPSTPTSEPTSSSAEPQATTERPPIKTALEVFREAEKQQRKPKAKSEITPTGDPAAAVAAAPAAPAAPKGPIPFEVHDTAVKNARTKGAAEARAQVEQEYASIKQWATKAATDRVGFLRDVISEALQDPTLGPQIRSLAGQTLNGGRTSAPAEAPKPDFQDGQGNQFFSAKTQEARDQWLIAKVKAEILGEVQPDLDQVRSEREQKAIAEAEAHRDREMKSHIAEAKKLPHFDKFKAEIHAAAAAMPLTDGHPASEAQVLNRAYWQVVGPRLSELEQQKVMKDLQSRANASSLNPASTGAPSGIPKNVAAKTGGTFADALTWAQAQTAGR